MIKLQLNCDQGATAFQQINFKNFLNNEGMKMQLNKILAITTLGLLLTACSGNQMEADGSAGKKHSHAMPGAEGDIVHSHGAPNDPSHSHTLEEIKGLINN
jgi:hypothetical protein